MGNNEGDFMDRTKLSIIVSVVMIIFLATYIVINLQTQDMLKDVRELLNETDYDCCTIYRNPIMPNLCRGLRSNEQVYIPYVNPNLSTSVPSFP